VKNTVPTSRASLMHDSSYWSVDIGGVTPKFWGVPNLLPMLYILQKYDAIGYAIFDTKR